VTVLTSDSEMGWQNDDATGSQLSILVPPRGPESTILTLTPLDSSRRRVIVFTELATTMSYAIRRRARTFT